MGIVIPKYLALDTSTLSKISRDFWSSDDVSRAKARLFLDEIKTQSIFIAFSFTHVVEFLRHENDQEVRNRFRFLSRLPLIAWVRPYDRSWFTGSVVDVHRRELHVNIHDEVSDWNRIVSSVRNEIWETGVGKDMFVNTPVWDHVISEARSTTDDERRIASIAKTDMGDVEGLTLTEISELPIRPVGERLNYLAQQAKSMDSQIKKYGDKKLDDSQRAAVQFAQGTLARIRQLESEGGDIREKIIRDSGVPLSLVSEGMTVRELGELGILAKRIEVIATGLVPSVTATIETIGETTLPSLTLEERLRRIQLNEPGVFGSNFGDSYLAVLCLYADYVEVDKRTNSFLNRIRKNDEKLSSLMGTIIREPDYTKIPLWTRVGT